MRRLLDNVTKTLWTSFGPLTFVPFLYNGAMLSESRKKKLQILTQSLLRGDVDGARKVLEAAGRAKAGTDPVFADDAKAGLVPVFDVPTFAMDLADACPGAAVDGALPAGPGRHWLIRRTLAEIAPDDAGVSARYAAVLRGAGQRLDELEASVGLCHAAGAAPEDVLFMDIETCGLGGTAIFLVGTMFFEGGGLVFEQHLARDYSEEPAILRAFAAKCESAGLLVTFNGKSFDMNQIRERCVFHGIDALEGPKLPHLDLLHEARKRWRKRVPNCRLQTLEQVFCNRRRVGDIPGWAIPEAYHRFVSTSDARPLREIVHHNMLDLLTMAELLCAALTGGEPA